MLHFVINSVAFLFPILQKKKTYTNMNTRTHAHQKLYAQTSVEQSFKYFTHHIRNNINIYAHYAYVLHIFRRSSGFLSYLQVNSYMHTHKHAYKYINFILSKCVNVFLKFYIHVINFFPSTTYEIDTYLRANTYECIECACSVLMVLLYACT